MTVKFELSDADLHRFRELMREARADAEGRPLDELIEAGRTLLAHARSGALPAFVADRLDKLGVMIAMLGDSQWELPPLERARVMNALAYFCAPGGLIPDETPALGLIDDAIMIELVVHELDGEMDCYEDFCRFREEERERRGDVSAEITRREWLDARRHGPSAEGGPTERQQRSIFSLFSS